MFKKLYVLTLLLGLLISAPMVMAQDVTTPKSVQEAIDLCKQGAKDNLNVYHSNVQAIIRIEVLPYVDLIKERLVLDVQQRRPELINRLKAGETIQDIKTELLAPYQVEFKAYIESIKPKYYGMLQKEVQTVKQQLESCETLFEDR